MKPSEIVLDAIAEMVASEPRQDERSITLGLEPILFALCLDTGMNEQELRAELETRIHLYRVNERKLKLIVGGLADAFPEWNRTH